MKEKISLESKHLSLIKKDIIIFTLFFCLKRFRSIKNQVYTAIILDPTPGYVITVRF